MGACNTTKHKQSAVEIDKSAKIQIVTQNRISDKTIFDGIYYLSRCQ